MNLLQKIAKQRKTVAEFESSLQDVLTPPKYPAPPSEPLTYLQNLLATATDDRDRAEKLQAAQTALEHSRKVLAELESEQNAIDVAAAAKAARSELQTVIQEFNDLSDRLAAVAAKLLEAEKSLRPALAAERDVINPLGCDLLNGLPVAMIAPDGLKISPRSQQIWQRPLSPFA